LIAVTWQKDLVPSNACVNTVSVLLRTTEPVFEHIFMPVVQVEQFAEAVKPAKAQWI